MKVLLKETKVATKGTLGKRNDLICDQSTNACKLHTS
jgi:hypothetical protein